MTGMDEFNQLFGGVTLSQIILLGMAGAFLFGIWRIVKAYLDKRYKAKQEKDEAEKQHNEQLKMALEEINKYPEYRQQSIKIQKELQNEIKSLRETIVINTRRLDAMEANQRRESLNRLRDILLERYRFYMDPQRNPGQCWSKGESEAFWALYEDYERAGGNGCIHSEVRPAMNKLRITEEVNTHE